MNAAVECAGSGAQSRTYLFGNSCRLTKLTDGFWDASPAHTEARADDLILLAALRATLEFHLAGKVGYLSLRRTEARRKIAP